LLRMDTTIKHRGLTGTLHKIGASPFYRLHFRHPSSMERQRISLATSDLSMAKAKAKAILEQTATEGLGALKDFTRKTSSESIGAACDHYLQTSKVDSRKDNVNALLVVLRDGLGVTDREKLRALPLTRLNRKLVSDFLRKTQLAPASQKTNLAMGRAVFCRANDWEGFDLPDLAEFRDATAKTGIRANLDAFVPLTADVLATLEEKSKLAGGGIRRAFLLARRCGMTPTEIAACRKGWIEKRGGKHELLLVQRPDEGFTLKTGSRRQRQIVLPDAVAAELLEADDYMVPGGTTYTRHNWCMRIMNNWLREFLPGRKDLLYCLRKQAGSDLLNATGRISTVSRFLGHTTSSTTERHYATMDQRVELPD
jgi:integrase